MNNVLEFRVERDGKFLVGCDGYMYLGESRVHAELGAAALTNALLEFNLPNVRAPQDWPAKREHAAAELACMLQDSRRGY